MKQDASKEEEEKKRTRKCLENLFDRMFTSMNIDKLEIKYAVIDEIVFSTLSFINRHI